MMNSAASRTIPIRWVGDRAFTVAIEPRRLRVRTGWLAATSPDAMFDLVGRPFWETGKKQNQMEPEPPRVRLAVPK